MPFRILRRSSHASMPWKNGGGITHEVIREPDGSDLDLFDWRLSFAEVATPGEFSRFADVDRLITLVRGEMTLVVDGVNVPLDRFAPYAFPGESAVAVLDGGPSLDLNVMTRRGRCSAAMECVRFEQSAVVVPPSAGSRTCLVAVLDGHVRTMAPAGSSVELSALDVIVAGDGPLVLGGTGAVAVITISAEVAGSGDAVERA